MGYCIYELVNDNLDINVSKHFGFHGTEDNEIAVYLGFQGGEYDIKTLKVDFDSKLSVIENEVQKAIDNFETSFVQMVNEGLKAYTEALEQVNNGDIEGDIFLDDYDFGTIEGFDNVSDEELENIKDSINGNDLGYLDRDTKGGWQNA